MVPGSSHEAGSGAPEWYACFQRFHVLFHFLFKVLFIFPSRYLCAIGLSQIFSFGRTLPPSWRCSPKQHDSREGSLVEAFRRYGAITLSGSVSQYRITPGATNRAHTQATIRPPRAAGFQFELIPLHSPLLRESWLVSLPPLSNMFKFGGSSCLSPALKHEIEAALHPCTTHLGV